MATPAPTASEIELKPVGQLLQKHFIVPSYQRGYRWMPQQVQDLLEDLTDFAKYGAPDVLYCLQPIIVLARNGSWELIDGQQRLTTIYILLKYIEQKTGLIAEEPFSLEYETRTDSLDFLQKIDSARANDNIDFYYINQAYICIDSWMQAQQNQDMAARHLHEVLLARTGIIWYQIDESQDPHDIFIRINSGKIPLTNAELVKALFLKRRGDDVTAESQDFRQRQLEIASEWHNMEAELQRPEFWYFINPTGSDHVTRIEFVLNNLARTQPSRKDEYATFRAFSSTLANLSTQKVSDEWQRVKNLFLLFQQWFEERTLYHWIGYLLATGEPLNALVERASELPKSEFLSHLLTLIRAKVSRRPVESLRFHNKPDKLLLHHVLLLFNVETLRQNDYASYRFPFHQYQGNGDRKRTWSLEHIHAQQDPGFTTPEKFHQWLHDIHPFVAEAVTLPAPLAKDGSTLDPGSILTEINAALAQSNLDGGKFAQIQEQVVTLFGEPELHDITNLALLRTSDNSALSNGVFPQKRAKIMELERRGSFIPIATRNVFLKYYSSQASHLSYWTDADREAYLNAIRTTLAAYLPATSSDQ